MLSPLDPILGLRLNIIPGQAGSPHLSLQSASPVYTGRPGILLPRGCHSKVIDATLIPLRLRAYLIQRQFLVEPKNPASPSLLRVVVLVLNLYTVQYLTLNIAHRPFERDNRLDLALYSAVSLSVYPP